MAAEPAPMLVMPDLPKLLQEEVDYWLDLDGHEPTTEHVYHAVCSVEDSEVANGSPDRQLLLACRKYLIACGHYREITEAEIARCYVSRGKAWDFKLDGVKYVFAGHIF